MSPLSPAPIGAIFHVAVRNRRVSLIMMFCGVVTAAGLAEPALDRDAIWRDIFGRDMPAPVGSVAGDTSIRAELGARLFSDPRLSGTGKRACSGCHQPEQGFTDGLARAAGLDGKPLERNTPHLFNLAWAKNLFWDGRAKSLEAQALQPITAANELNGDFATIIARLSRDPSMTAAFGAAFDGPEALTQENILLALAAYQRSIVSKATRFDAWVSGDDGALSDQEKAGFDIFVGKGGCVSCHGGWRFTDDSNHDTGLPADAGASASQAFKTPGLRELARTAPYMHDGSLPTLAKVIDHYAGGVAKRASVSSNIVRDLELKDDEKAALITFLESLSSDGAE